MRKYLQGAAVALLLSGTAFATAGVANAQDNRYGEDSRYNNDQPNVGISFQFGDVATGYRDGYIDTNRNFHRWNGDNDYRAYRSQHADNYRDWNHDRDANNGAVSVSFGNVAMGYRDGYWDNGHNFHRWNNDSDYRTYRDQHVSNYRDWNHDRDANNGVISISFGDVSEGYRDGYWDNGHRWHRWNNDGDYRSYRDMHGSNYHDWNHDRGGSGISIGFGGIAFGYRDGYWDGGHHWHHWRHRNDYRNYRDQNGSHYHDTYHYREDNNGWRQQ